MRTWYSEAKKECACANKNQNCGDNPLIFLSSTQVALLVKLGFATFIFATESTEITEIKKICLLLQDRSLCPLCALRPAFIEIINI